MDIQTIELLPLLGYDLRKVGAYYIGPCPLCGGRDRFTVKHTARGDRWHCRQCGDGKYHDAIYFVMKRDHVSHKQALQTLGLGVLVAPIPQLPEAIKPMETPSKNWQASAWRFVDLASDRLFTNDGEVGREYLTSRGLTRATLYAWHLGFSYVHDPIAQRVRPAIVLPWITTADEEITAIKFRFVGDDSLGSRYSFMPGSIPLLFGGWDLIASAETLLLIEGEINALSIWQQRQRGVSVVSFGSEPEGEVSETRAAIFRDMAMNYERVIIWCDEGARPRAYEKILGRPCRKLQSPNTGNSKADANRLLILGELPDFISQVLGMVPLNREAESMT